MKNVGKALFLTLLVLGAAGTASADFTTTVYGTVVPSSAFPATFENYIGSPGQLSWAFDWSADLAVLAAQGVPTVTSASLVVAGTSIASDVKHLVYLNGDLVGQINSGTGNTTFNLLPDYLADLDGSVNMSIQLFVDSRYNKVGYRVDTFNSSSLTLGYFVDVPEPPVPPVPPQPPVVPAPAAVVLSSLGAGLVGWLRKRGMMA